MVRWCSSRRGCIRTDEGSCPSHRNHDSPSFHPRPSGHSCQRVDLWMTAWGRFRFHRGKQSCGNHFQFPIPYSLLPDEGSLGEARQPGSQAWGQRLAWEAPARCTLSPHEPHKRPTHKHGHTRPGSLSERTMFFLQGLPSSRASGQQGRVGRGPGVRGRDRAGVGLPIFCSQSHRGGGCWPGRGADKPVG